MIVVYWRQARNAGSAKAGGRGGDFQLVSSWDNYQLQDVKAMLEGTILENRSDYPCLQAGRG